MYILIDVDCVDKNTADTFDGLKHSINRFFAPNGDDILFEFRGQYIDSGGGGTLHALASLIETNKMQHDAYLISSYALHNIQTVLRNTSND